MSQPETSQSSSEVGPGVDATPHGRDRLLVLGAVALLLAGASPDPSERRDDSPSRASDPSEGAAADGAEFEGTIRTGVEYDSNAKRLADGQGVVRDGLSRYFASLEGQFRGTGRSSLQIHLRQGGKLFFRTSEADALLTEAGLTYRHRLSTHWRARLDVGLKDRLERQSRQDYSRGRATGGIGLRLGPVDLGLDAGWRYFAFRPNPSSSSHGPTTSFVGGVRLLEKVRLYTQYTLSHRRFRADRLVRRDGLIRRDEGRARRDGLHAVRLGLGYRGSFIVEGRYVFWANLSNSYGQNLTRHGAHLNATVPLPWRLYVSSQLRLQRTRYEDPLFLGPNFTVDENDRNSVVASLTRVIGEHWEVEGRYRLFIEEFGAASSYRRQTGFIGVGYVF